MRQRRILQGLSVGMLGLALACAPMAAASAHVDKAKHHKPKPKPKKPDLTVGSPTCKNFLNTEKGSSGLAPALEKALENAGTGFAGVQSAIISYINAIEKYEAPFEADLRSAPANVQSAAKGIFAFFNTIKSDVANATSLQGLGTTMASLGTSTTIESDATILANYFGTHCGSLTPTTT